MSGRARGGAGTAVTVKQRRRNKPLGTRASARPADVVRGREPVALPRGSGLRCCQQNCRWRGRSLGTPGRGLTSQALFTLPCRGVPGWCRSALAAGQLQVRGSLLDLCFPLPRVKQMLLHNLVRSAERYVGNHGSRVKEFALFLSSHVSEGELRVSVPTAASGRDVPPVLRVP